MKQAIAILYLALFAFFGGSTVDSAIAANKCITELGAVVMIGDGSICGANHNSACDFSSWDAAADYCVDSTHKTWSSGCMTTRITVLWTSPGTLWVREQL